MKGVLPMKKLILALLILSCVSVPAKACNYGVAAFSSCYAQPVYAQAVYAQPVYAQAVYAQAVVAQPVCQQQLIQQVQAPVYAQPLVQQSYGVQAFSQPVYAQQLGVGYGVQSFAFRGGYSQALAFRGGHGVAAFRGGFRQAAVINPLGVGSVQSVTVNRGGLFGRRTSVNVQQISGGAGVQAIRVR
jgi:hypothetical protein